MNGMKEWLIMAMVMMVTVMVNMVMTAYNGDDGQHTTYIIQ
jgi:hypothetical protein